MADVQSCPRWYVYQTRPNQEFFVERQLQRSHFSTYVPFEMVDKTRMGVVIGRERRALFRSYGFVRFDVATDDWRKVWRAFGVKRLISTTPEHPIAMPLGAVESLQLVVLDLVPLEQDIIVVPACPAAPIALHSEVEVKAGLFAGRTGIVQSTHGTRAKLLMDILGDKVPVSFRLVNLRTTDKQDDQASIASKESP